MSKDISPEGALHALVQAKMAERKAVNEKNTKRRDALVLSADLFLELVDHSRTSCSDKDPCNYSSDPSQRQPSCLRCQLLRIKEDGYNDDWVLDMQLRYAPNVSEDYDEIRKKLKEV